MTAPICKQCVLFIPIRRGGFCVKKSQKMASKNPACEDFKFFKGVKK